MLLDKRILATKDKMEPGEIVEGEAIHPTLSREVVKNIIANPGFNLLDERNFEISIDPISTIEANGSGTQAVLTTHFAPSFGQFKRIKIQHATYTELVDILNNPEKYPDAFFRLYNDENGVGTLFAIRDPKQHFGLKHSRSFPIIAEAEGTRVIEEQGINVNDSEEAAERLYSIIAADPTLEQIKNFEVAIIGGGTVAIAILTALAKLGVKNFVFYELEDETLSLPNVERAPETSELDVGKPKWREMIDLAVANNPMINIKYVGAYSRENGSHLKEFKGKKTNGEKAVFLALDKEELRAHAHRVLEDLELETVALADLGYGSQMQNFNYSDPTQASMADKLEKADTDTKRRIVGLGGPLSVVYRFDEPLVRAALSKDAYGYLPQAHIAALLTQVLSIYYIIQRVKGEEIADSFYMNPVFQSMSLPEKLMLALKKLAMLSKSSNNKEA